MQNRKILGSAHQDATPMLSITNGQFDQLLTQWDTRGSIQVNAAAVTLREDDRANPFRLACPRTITIDDIGLFTDTDRLVIAMYRKTVGSAHPTSIASIPTRSITR